jgi:quercetin dioxygenase-like cupin family protein
MSNQRLQGWNKQKTVFTYAKDRKFEMGFRSGGLYADLGVAEATGGNFHAHLIKVNPEKHSEQGTTGMHRHDYDLQFNYMISGEIDFVIEGIDEVLTFRAGDTYLLPHKILHNEIRVTEDYQVLELYGPAKSGTVQVDQGVEGGVVSEDWANKQSKMSEQRLQSWNKQTPAFTYAKDREFGPGLRGASLYADLGLAEATGGQFHGEIIKMNPDKLTEQTTTGMHRHEYDLQFNYVLSGRIEFVFDGMNDGLGDEKLVFGAGDTYFQASRVLHNETLVSADYSVMQVYGPAKASTEQITPEIS